MNISNDRRHNAAKHIAFIMLNVAIFRTHRTQGAYSPISSFAPSNEESSNFFAIYWIRAMSLHVNMLMQMEWGYKPMNIQSWLTELIISIFIYFPNFLLLLCFTLIRLRQRRRARSIYWQTKRERERESDDEQMNQFRKLQSNWPSVHCFGYAFVQFFRVSILHVVSCVTEECLCQRPLPL